MKQRMGKLALVLAVSVSLLTPSISLPVQAATTEKNSVIGEVLPFSEEIFNADNSEEPETRTYADGVYEGSAKGRNDEIKVSVTVKDGVISDIKVLEQKETPSFFEKAIVMIDRIIEHQSTDVDNVSGATLSSIGIRQAVYNALNPVSEEPSEDDEEVKPLTEIFKSGSGKENDPYVITTETELREFAQSLNKDRDYAGIYIVLENDIDLSDKEWIPVGKGKYEFNGIFDGQGHTISGMSAGTKDAPTKLDMKAPHWGLFGYLDRDAVVKNINVKNMEVYVTCDVSAFAGGVAGLQQGHEDDLTDEGQDDLRGAVVDNVTVDGTLSLSTKQGNAFAGGITGYMYEGALVNSSADVNIYNVAKDEDVAETGGLVGMNNAGMVANCDTEGYIYGSGNRENGLEGMAAVSGLVGVNAGSLVNCYTSADIETKELSTYAGMVSGRIMGTGKTYHCYYAADSKMTINGRKIAPIESVGANSGKLTNDEGTRYIGGLVDDVEAVAKDELENYPMYLNYTFRYFPIKADDFGVSFNGFRKWAYDSENTKLCRTEEFAEAEYEEPEIEIADKKEDTMGDGAWYGRSEDKSTVVKITVKDNEVSDTEVLSGETSGDKYDEALEIAKRKAVWGDFTDYSKADTSEFTKGSGTKEDPYLVENETQLRSIATEINADVTWENVYFKQTKDIEVSRDIWLPIGYAVQHDIDGFGEIVANYPFFGNYDGGDHTITGIKIDNTVKYAGLYTYGMFGFTEGKYNTKDQVDGYAVNLKNIHLKDLFINSEDEHSALVGGLVGAANYGTFIDNCSVEGSVCDISGDDFDITGGLVGSMTIGRVLNSWTDVEVYAAADATIVYAGGLIGMSNRTTVVNSCAYGNVGANAGSNNMIEIGGLIGMDAGVVINSFANGEVSAEHTAADIGAVEGRIAEIGFDVNSYFDKKALIKELDTELTPVYAGGRVFEEATDGVEAVDTRSADFAETLNSNIKNMPTLVEKAKAYLGTDESGRGDNHCLYYTGDGSDLKKWEYKNGRVVLVDAEAPAPEPENPKTSDDKKDKAVYTEVTFKTSDGSELTLKKNNATGVYTDAEGDIAVVISTNEISAPDKKGNAKAEISAHYSYTGKKLKPGVKSYVVVDGTAYVYGKDYKVSVKGGLHAGKLTAVYKFKKNAAVYKSGIKKITQNASVEAKTVTAEDVTVKLNKKQTKVVSIADKETKKKISKKNYTVDMSAKTVTFKGDYAGTVKF